MKNTIISSISFLTILVFSAFITGCAVVGGSHVVTGEIREPIDPGDVVVYNAFPKTFKEIALVSAKAGNDFKSEQKIMDAAMERLKKEAAKVGANGIVIEAIRNRSDPTVTTAFGSAGTIGMMGNDTGNAISVNVGNRYGKITGIAIYVPNEEQG